MPKPSARARKIKLLPFDVNGVLTDGRLFFLPTREQNPQAASELHVQGSIEFKGFRAHDGVAIVLARIGGVRTGLITTRFSETVALRAPDLKIEFVRQGIQDKRAAFEEIIKEIGIKPGGSVRTATGVAQGLEESPGHGWSHLMPAPDCNPHCDFTSPWPGRS